MSKKLRRQFDLPEADREALEDSGYTWESVVDGNVCRIVIHDFPVPSGYCIESAAASGVQRVGVGKIMLNVRIERGYPTAQIDMVYFFPALVRADGRSIAALSQDAFDGKTWQRWSRHRTGANPWRVGIDNVQAHLLLVSDWLEREFKK